MSLGFFQKVNFAEDGKYLRPLIRQYMNHYVLCFHPLQKSDEFKQKPLSAISKHVVSAAQELKTITVKERTCLKELSKCSNLINWIRKEIQGTLQHLWDF